MSNSSHHHSGPLSWGLPLLVALTAGVLIGMASLPAGRDFAPGMTLDEPFNVQEGVRLTYGIPAWVRGELSLREVFGDNDDLKDRKQPLGTHLADHPPLGRLWLGVFHDVALRNGLVDSGESPFSIPAARLGSAVAFAITVFLVGWFTGRYFGPVAGLLASVALVTMPRVFGHAHLASLETMMNLTFTASILSVAVFWRDKPPRPRTAALTGCLFGLALLTKIQAVLIPVPVALWALWRYRQQAIVPLVIWGIAGSAVFFAGWPWLWLDPLHHPLDYFQRSAERVVLHTFYLGERFRDRDVPWHYPFVMFLTTVPVIWVIFGGMGAFRWSSEKPQGGDLHENSASEMKWGKWLLGGVTLFPLVLFAAPGIVVYDGVRLFLVVFPFAAIFSGRGGAIFLRWLVRRNSLRVAAACGVAVIAMPVASMSLILPHYLSYYNVLTGGLWGAEKLGLEPTYWGDSLSPVFLDEVAIRVPEGAVVDVVPVMHPLQVPLLTEQSAEFRRKRIVFRAYDPNRNGRGEFVLFFRRRADLSPELQTLPDDAEIVAEVRRQGVLLAALLRFRR